MRLATLQVSFSLLLALGLAGKADAQLGPTLEPVCYVGDTIRWTLPDLTNRLCRLEAVQVYGAKERDEPFEPLPPIVDPSLRTYYVLKPEDVGEYRFFYVVGYYNGTECRNGAGRLSDTISTLPLPKVPIRVVDFGTGGTTLAWDRPDDPRVSGYIVYRDVDQRPQEIGRTADTSFLDVGTDVEPGGTYYLSVSNACESTGLFSSPYASGRAEVRREVCAGEVSIATALTADDWPLPLVRAEVERTRLASGGVDTVRLDGTGVGDSIRIVDLPPDTAYSVRVTYYDSTGASTTTYPVDLPAEPVVLIDTLEVVQLTFEADDWQLRWRWDERADYRDITWRIVDGGGGELEGGVDSVAAKLGAPSVPLDLGPGFDWRSAQVTIAGTDACGVRRESAPARPPTLTAAEVDPIDIALDWTLADALRLDHRYSELRLLDPGDTLDVGGSQVIYGDPTATSYRHDAREVNERLACYEVVVEVDAPPTLGRPAATFPWRSAPTCAVRSPRVYLPTGFQPSGVTATYQPRVSLLDDLVGAYTFRIFDRWGQLVFESDVPYEGWDGRVQGRALPGGTYVANVELAAADGERYRYEAVFALIR